jgi:hydrogenase maturation protein HypF
MAYAHLREAGMLDHPAAANMLAELGERQTQLLSQMLERKLNSPLTSSMGRLFDAVSAILGICRHSTYDGQAAIELEAAIYDSKTAEPWCDPDADAASARYQFAIETPCGTQGDEFERSYRCLQINPAPLLQALLDDLKANTSTGIIALRFHNAVVELAVQIAKHTAAIALAKDLQEHRRGDLWSPGAEQALSVTSLQSVEPLSTPGRPQAAPTLSQPVAQHTVALSGGVFMNRYLAERIPLALKSAGFQTIDHINLPPNDGCVSHGQAAVAATMSAIYVND